MARILLILTMAFATHLSAFEKNDPNYREPETCPFCQDREEDTDLRQRTVYEGELARVFLDRAPTVPGHLLVTPKRHICRIELIKPEEMQEILQIFQMLSGVYQGAFDLEDFMILQRNGEGVGQTVFHVHFHCFPANMPGVTTLLEELVNRKPILPPEVLYDEAARIRPYFLKG